MSRTVTHVLVACCLIAGGLVLAAGIALAQKPRAVENQQQAEKISDVLEGTLKIHPKFHYRYYLGDFGNGQTCALFKADDQLKELKVGTRIRVRGKLASKYFGNPDDKMAALISTWILFMEVDELTVLKDR